MPKTLIAAAAMAAIVYAFAPAHAAKVHAGCSGENLGKTEATIEGMADGPGKYAAQKEVSLAQEALLSGKMGVCAAHLARASNAGLAR